MFESGTRGVGANYFSMWSEEYCILLEMPDILLEMSNIKQQEKLQVRGRRPHL